jgi:hypothetical protein
VTENDSDIASAFYEMQSMIDLLIRERNEARAAFDKQSRANRELFAELDRARTEEKRQRAIKSALPDVGPALHAPDPRFYEDDQGLTFKIGNHFITYLEVSPEICRKRAANELAVAELLEAEAVAAATTPADETSISDVIWGVLSDHDTYVSQTVVDAIATAVDAHRTRPTEGRTEQDNT